jgi:predicted signal transduction protein with EAL and GGDEF domain
MVGHGVNLDCDRRDRLTGLPDAVGARAQLAAWAGETSDRGGAVHAMLIGLGRFDAVNLAYGEAAGDGALVEVARRMSHFAEDEFAPGEWFAARIGGGKFLLAAREACSRERWQWLAEALAEAVAHPIGEIDDAAGIVRLWPRIALLRVLAGEGPDAAFDRLAHVLDRAMGRHGSRVHWVDGNDSVPGRRGALLEADLLAALDRGQIEVVFQPQFALADDRLVGAEALARWKHPELGQIGAGPLFAIAERADHVAPLSRTIAAQALAAASAWPDHLRLSLNVTPADLAAGSFAREFLALADSCGFPAERLTVEITEQVLLGDLERAARALAALARQGMRIALDDFGGGFCNFRYLKILPLDYLKLDRSMIEHLAEDPRDLAVFRAIAALARALALELIAEGIETEAQRARAAREGAAFYQGFLRAVPMSGSDFIRFAAR